MTVEDMNSDEIWGEILPTQGPVIPVRCTSESPGHLAGILAAACPGCTPVRDAMSVLDEAERIAAEQTAAIAKANRVDGYVRDYLERQEARHRAEHQISVERHGTLADKIETASQARTRPMPEYLVEDVLHVGAVCLLYGSSQACKTWIALALANSVATGLEWPQANGNMVRQARGLYVAAEDPGIIGMRLGFWEKANGVLVPDGSATEGLDIFPEAVDILDPFRVDELCELITQHRYRIIVFDTVSSSLRGAEEGNSEFSLAVHHMKKLAAAMTPSGGGTVILVHHKGKDGDKGARGGSSLFNDADIVWRVDGDPYRIKMVNEKWKIDKQREDINLRLQLDPFPHLVTIGAEVAIDPDEFKPNQHIIMRDVILQYCTDHALDGGGHGVSSNAIIGNLAEQGIKARRAVALEIIATMVADGRLIETPGPNRSKLHRTPPAPPEQAELGSGSD